MEKKPGEDAEHCWQISRQGMMSMTAVQGLHSQEPASRCRPNVALEDATGWELICRLEDADFQWQRLPSKNEAKLALEPYRSGGARVWYSTAVQLRKEYMHALIVSDTLFEKGITQICHWHKNGPTYYSRLLDGKMEVIALEDAVEHGRPALESGVEPVPIVPRLDAAIEDAPRHEDRCML